VQREIIYLGRSNTIDLLLKADGVAVDLTDVTAISLTVNGDKFESTNKAAGFITWDQVGYATGEIRIALGAQTITPGTFDAPLIVTDPTNPTGLDWGDVSVRVLSDREGTTP